MFVEMFLVVDLIYKGGSYLLHTLAMQQSPSNVCPLFRLQFSSFVCKRWTDHGQDVWVATLKIAIFLGSLYEEGMGFHRQKKAGKMCLLILSWRLGHSFCCDQRLTLSNRSPTKVLFC